MMLFKKDDLKESKKEVSHFFVPDSLNSGTTLPDALDIYRDVINQVLRERGIDAKQAYKPDSGLWILPAQPRPIVLRLKSAGEKTDTEEETDAEAETDTEDYKDYEDYIEAIMRLGPLPAQNLLAFYRVLLEANMRLSNAAFALDSDGVFLRHQRPLAGLDEDELNDILSSLMSAATDEFNPLIEQFIFGASIVR